MFHILKLISALFTQIASLYLVYLLTPEEFGLFALIATVAQLMYTLTSGWSNGSVINLGSQSFARTGSYKAIVYYRVCIVAMSFVVVCLAFSVLKPFIEGYMKIGGMLPYVLMLFLGYVFYDHASQLLYPGNRDLIQSLSEFVATLALLLIVFFVVHDLKSYILLYAVVSTVFAIIISLTFLKFYSHHSFLWRGAEFQSVLNYSAWQVVGVISIYIVNMGTNFILVVSDISMLQIGLYNFAYRLYSGFAPIFSLFGILIPKWVHSSSDGVRKVEGRLLVIVCMLGTFYLMMGFALTPILQMFNMERYSVSLDYFFWLFPAFLLTSYANLLNTVIANTQHFRSAQTGIFLQSVAILIFGFPLVSILGVSGAIIAITVASAFGAMYFNWIFRKVLIQTKR